MFKLWTKCLADDMYGRKTQSANASVSPSVSIAFLVIGIISVVSAMMWLSTMCFCSPWVHCIHNFIVWLSESQADKWKGFWIKHCAMYKGLILWFCRPTEQPNWKRQVNLEETVERTGCPSNLKTFQITNTNYVLYYWFLRSSISGHSC